MLSVRLSTLLVVSAAGSVPGPKNIHYCAIGSDGKPANKPIPLLQTPAGMSLKLLQVQTLMRHGARTTLKFCENPGWSEIEKDCTLSQFELPTKSATCTQPQEAEATPSCTSTTPGRLFRMNYVVGQNGWKGNTNCLHGQLLAIGYDMQENNGRELREAYVTSPIDGSAPNSFLPTSMTASTASDFYFVSDDFERTKASGQALVHGLYPTANTNAGENDAEVVQWNVVGSDKDKNFLQCAASSDFKCNLCPRLTEQIQKSQNHKNPPYVKYSHLANKTKNVLKVALQKVGYDKTLPYWGCIMGAVCAGKAAAVVPGLDMSDYVPWLAASWGAAAAQLSYTIDYSEDPPSESNTPPPAPTTLGSISGGFIMQHFLDQFANAVALKPAHKFVLWSAHDLSIEYVLSALGLWDADAVYERTLTALKRGGDGGAAPPVTATTSSWPSFAAMLNIELYSCSSGCAGEAFYARMVYQGVVLQLPGPCKGRELCPWSAFEATLQEHAVTSASPKCKKAPPAKSDSDSGSSGSMAGKCSSCSEKDDTITTLAVVCGLLGCTTLALLFLMCLRTAKS